MCLNFQLVSVSHLPYLFWAILRWPSRQNGHFLKFKLSFWADGWIYNCLIYFILSLYPFSRLCQNFRSLTQVLFEIWPLWPTRHWFDPFLRRRNVIVPNSSQNFSICSNLILLMKLECPRFVQLPFISRLADSCSRCVNFKSWPTRLWPTNVFWRFLWILFLSLWTCFYSPWLCFSKVLGLKLI